MAKKPAMVMAVLLALSLVALVIGCIGDEALDPAVNEVLAVRLPEVTPEDNSLCRHQRAR